MSSHGDIILGLMSGTSADGLDIAICDVQGKNNIVFLAGYSFPYPDNLHREISELQVSITAKNVASVQIQALDNRIASFAAQACKDVIKRSTISQSDIQAIANHGQTILHQPSADKPFSLQIGNAKDIANALNITVISDFRTTDIETGGQGAPLIPAFHQAVFQQYAPCNIVNIGGIANITSLDSDPNKILGFDIGPGNTLLDQWNKQHKKTTFDKNGDWARSGNCNNTLLNELLNEPYFSEPHPKSTGQDLFNLAWLNQKIKTLPNYQTINAKDIQRTLSELTASSISNAIQSLNQETRPLYLCGGGVHNTHLVKQIKASLPKAQVSNTQDIGIHPDWVEAMGFAWLGYCRLNQINSNIPKVTGATRSVSLGTITQPEQPS